MDSPFGGGDRRGSAFWGSEGLERVAQLKYRGAGTLAQRLTEHREALYLSRRLTHIDCDVELGAAIDELLRAAPEMPALSGLYDELGCGPFLRRHG